MRRAFPCVSLLLALSSCSRLFPTDEARREIPISAPVVRIIPDAPSASDDLVAVIIEAAQDPRGESVRYDFVWRVGSKPRATTQLASRGLTQVGETWAVEVTPYVGERRGEPGRAIVRIGAPAAITAPTIHVEPAEPKTLDDLRVVIDAPSVDPEGEEVTYGYAWYRDDVPVRTTAVVPHEETTKAETWRVRVTPRAGERVGPSSDADVTVRNTPPVVGTVGLSTYLPVTTDTLVAHPSAIADADGDGITFAYAWRRNGSIPFLAHTLDTLDLAARGFRAGDTVEVTVTPSDGEDAGAPTTLGEIEVHAARTGWRAITPNRMPSGGPLSTRSGPIELGVAYDEASHRLIHLQTGDPWTVWEIPLDGPRRFVELRPRGRGPDVSCSGAQLVADPARNRLLVYDDGALHALELTRGNERWVSLPGIDDDARRDGAYRTPLLLDSARDRLVRVGRGGALEQTRLDEEIAWRPLATSIALTDRVGAAWLHAPGTDVAYLVGGFERSSVDPPRWSEPSSDVVRIDLVTGDARTLAALPRATAWATVAADPVRRRAYVVEGASEGHGGLADRDGVPYAFAQVTSYSDVVLAFDFDTETFTVLADAPGPVPPRAFGAAFWDPRARRVMTTVGYHERFRSDLIVVNPDGTRITYDAMGHETPPAMADPRRMQMPDGALFFDGSGDPEEQVGAMWSFDPSTSTFERHPLAPDPSFGAPSIRGIAASGAENLVANTRLVLASVAEDANLDVWFLDMRRASFRLASIRVVPPLVGAQSLPVSGFSADYVLGTASAQGTGLHAYIANAAGEVQYMGAAGSAGPSAGARIFGRPGALGALARGADDRHLVAWHTHGSNPHPWIRSWASTPLEDDAPSLATYDFPDAVVLLSSSTPRFAVVVGSPLLLVRHESHSSPYVLEAIEVADEGAYETHVPRDAALFRTIDGLLAMGGTIDDPPYVTETNAQLVLTLPP